MHFALDGKWHAVPFMMFPEGFPLELVEGLAAVLVPDSEGQVFVEAWSDGLVAISCIDRDRLADLDAALAWDGETFGLVAATTVIDDGAMSDERVFAASAAGGRPADESTVDDAEPATAAAARPAPVGSELENQSATPARHA